MPDPTTHDNDEEDTNQFEEWAQEVARDALKAIESVETMAAKKTDCTTMTRKIKRGYVIVWPEPEDTQVILLFIKHSIGHSRNLLPGWSARKVHKDDTSLCLIKGNKLCVTIQLAHEYIPRLLVPKAAWTKAKANEENWSPEKMVDIKARNIPGMRWTASIEIEIRDK
jgi:hypothetical protein